MVYEGPQWLFIYGNKGIEIRTNTLQLDENSIKTYEQKGMVLLK